MPNSATEAPVGPGDGCAENCTEFIVVPEIMGAGGEGVVREEVPGFEEVVGGEWIVGEGGGAEGKNGF